MSDEIVKRQRGRPIKIKPLEIINPEIIEIIQINEIQKIPRGRPKQCMNIINNII